MDHKKRTNGEEIRSVEFGLDMPMILQFLMDRDPMRLMRSAYQAGYAAGMKGVFAVNMERKPAMSVPNGVAANGHSRKIAAG